MEDIYIQVRLPSPWRRPVGPMGAEAQVRGAAGWAVTSGAAAAVALVDGGRAAGPLSFGD